MKRPIAEKNPHVTEVTKAYVEVMVALASAGCEVRIAAGVLLAYATVAAEELDRATAAE